MLISVLGTGCTKCDDLHQNVIQAIEKSGKDIQVEKVTDIIAIASMGVMVTPALAIDKKVKTTGKVLTVDEILALL